MTATASPFDFLAANDAIVERRDAHGADLQARAAARAAIVDPVTREIAAHMSADEQRSARLAHLQSLAHLAAAIPEGAGIPGASDRTHLALMRARAQGNYSAIEALERELDRDRDEEDQVLLIALAS